MGYPKEVYRRAWAIINNRRLQSIQRLKSNNAEAVRKIPEIGRIQSRMVETATLVTRAVVANPQKAQELIKQLGEKNLSLQSKRTTLLKEAGLPEDFLVEKFYCPHCKDTGYVGVNACDCFKTALKQQAFLHLSFVCEGQSCEFNGFNLDYYSNTPETDGAVPRQRMGEIFEFSKEYARNFSRNSDNLLMMGKTGLGKTHLSLSIAREVTTNGFGVVYTPVQRLMDKLESQKFSYSQEDKENYSGNLNSVLECDLLVLDDLGTEFITSFTNSVLYNIVNTRIVENRPTIVNTNLEPVELEKTYSQRMASRLGFAYKILRFYGSDIRFLMRQERYNKK